MNKTKELEAILRCYATVVVPDVTTDGQPCYRAYHPELEGCMSHGETPGEAVANLSEVTRLYLSSLAKRGLDIPSPQQLPSVTWADIGTRTGSDSLPQSFS